MNTFSTDKKNGARAFERSRRFTSGACGLALVLCAGCNRSVTAPDATIVVAPRLDGKTVKTSAKTSTSPKASGVTLSSWFAAVMKQLKEPARATAVVTPRYASVDIAAVARRHPAWQLADALERRGDFARAELVNQFSTRPLQSTLSRTSGTQSTLRTGFAFDAWRDGASGTRGGQNSFLAPQYFASQAVGASGTQPLLVSGLGQFHERMETRQQSVLNDFLRDLEEQQVAARDANSAARRAAMNEDIELARQLALADLAPFLPQDPIQLEMTNLRLQLLKNLFASEAERETARERLHELVRQWETVLRQQETERIALLTRLRDERPREIRTQREAEIVAAREASSKRDKTLRSEVWQDQSARIRADFADETSQFGIVLPAVEVGATQPPASRGNTRDNIAVRGTISENSGAFDFNGRDWFGTSIGFPSSVAPPATASTSQNATAAFDSLSSSQRAAQISALRALAWSDARQWARIAARRNRTRAQSPKGAKSIPPKSQAKIMPQES